MLQRQTGLALVETQSEYRFASILSGGEGGSGGWFIEQRNKRCCQHDGPSETGVEQAKKSKPSEHQNIAIRHLLLSI